MEKISLRRILSESLKHYKENFLAIFLICLIVYLPINMVELLLDYLLRKQDTVTSVIVLAVRLILILVGLTAAIAVIIVSNHSISNTRIGYREALKKAISVWPSAAYTDVLMAFILALLLLLPATPWLLYFGYHTIMLGKTYDEVADLADLPVKEPTTSFILTTVSFILLIPFLTYSVYWLFSLPAVVLRNKSGKAALDYSKKLVEGRWWRTMLYTLTIFILLGVILYPIFIISEYTGNPAITIPSKLILSALFSFFNVALTVFFNRIEEIKK